MKKYILITLIVLSIFFLLFSYNKRCDITNLSTRCLSIMLYNLE